MAFTIDSLERDNRHELTGLPVGGVYSISLVALVDLPSPVVGPVTPGKLMVQLAIMHANYHCKFYVILGISVVAAPVFVSMSGEGSTVAGTSYSLTCIVRLPAGVYQVSPNIQWKRPNTPFTPASSIRVITLGFLATLQLPSLQSSDAGEYLCQATYSLGGYTSPHVNGSFTLDVISKLETV